ncbi:hypothetical protein BCS42_01535 [Crenothrix sp. D3]|jgi:photosystem II stability/assembly factor-like uncharacterized protein|nr:hypothetical protein BCS42_01535 [Crenothrix sp. D3]
MKTKKDCNEIAWVVGNRDETNHGSIFFTEDGGETWLNQGQNSEALLEVNVTDLAVVDVANVWAVCTDNVIVRTIDGGNSWNKVLTTPDITGNPNLSSISIIDNNIWISGEKGLVYKSTDNFATKPTIIAPTFFADRMVQGIHAVTPDIIYAVGGNIGGNTLGFVAKTVDGGTTWEDITLPDDYELIGVKSAGIENIIVYGGQGNCLITHNNGLTWENKKVQIDSTGDINCMAMVNDQNFWIACDYCIKRTIDGGKTWTSATSECGSSYQFGIDALDANTALDVRNGEDPEDGAIYKTTDGGTTWTVKKATSMKLCKVQYAR